MLYHPLTSIPATHWVPIRRISCVHQPLPAARRVAYRKEWANTLLLLTRTDTLRQQPQCDALQLFLMAPDNPIDLAMTMRDPGIIRAVLTTIEQELIRKYHLLRSALFTQTLSFSPDGRKTKEPAGRLFKS